MKKKKLSTNKAPRKLTLCCETLLDLTLRPLDQKELKQAGGGRPAETLKASACELC